tara:strand:+ start:185 stop:358 length:174 start_codon:yes stop_codon:yes gene_type:complete
LLPYLKTNFRNEVAETVRKALEEDKSLIILPLRTVQYHVKGSLYEEDQQLMKAGLAD